MPTQTNVTSMCLLVVTRIACPPSLCTISALRSHRMHSCFDPTNGMMNVGELLGLKNADGSARAIMVPCNVDLGTREGRLVCTAKTTEPTPKEIEGCYVLCRSRGWLQQHCRAFLQLGLSSTTSASSTPNRLPGSRDGRRQAPPHQLNGRTAVRSSSRAYPGSTTYVPWPCFRWVSAYVALLVLTLQLMIGNGLTERY